MTTATHLLVGGALGSLVAGHPVVALGLGIVSHVPLDMVPHFDFRDYRRDVALGVGCAAVVIAGLAIRGHGASGAIWGMFGGIIPDLENLAWKMGLMKETRRVFPTHRKGWLRHGAALGRSNLLTQGALGLASLMVIWR